MCVSILPDNPLTHKRDVNTTGVVVGSEEEEEEESEDGTEEEEEEGAYLEEDDDGRSGRVPNKLALNTDIHIYT